MRLDELLGKDLLCDVFRGVIHINIIDRGLLAFISPERQFHYLINKLLFNISHLNVIKIVEMNFTVLVFEWVKVHDLVLFRIIMHLSTHLYQSMLSTSGAVRVSNIAV